MKTQIKIGSSLQPSREYLLSRGRREQGTLQHTDNRGPSFRPCALCPSKHRPQLLLSPQRAGLNFIPPKIPPTSALTGPSQEPRWKGLLLTPPGGVGPAVGVGDTDCFGPFVACFSKLLEHVACSTQYSPHLTGPQPCQSLSFWNLPLS